MKIRVDCASSVPIFPGCIVWNIPTIDEFAERFIRDDMLVVVDYQLPIRNFVKHNQCIGTFELAEPNKYTGEFETVDQPRLAVADIVVALMDVGVQQPGRGALYNVRIAAIPDDQDPLRNPKVEAARRADRESGE